MVCFLPNAFVALANQIVKEEVLPDMEEAEQFGLMAQLVLAKQATFDKPAKNRHMRLLYLRGYVNGKPLTKMFVDEGAAVLGGLEIEPSHTQKIKSGYAKDAGSKTPRSNRFHFHPLGTAFHQAPFAATKAISTNPT
jgi:hypothetical protein